MNVTYHKNHIVKNIYKFQTRFQLILLLLKEAHAENIICVSTKMNSYTI